MCVVHNYPLSLEHFQLPCPSCLLSNTQTWSYFNFMTKNLKGTLSTAQQCESTSPVGSPSHSLRPLFYAAFSFSQSLKPFPSLSSDDDLVSYFKEKNRSNTVKAVSLPSHQLTPTSLLATVPTRTLLLL